MGPQDAGIAVNTIRHMAHNRHKWRIVLTAILLTCTNVCNLTPCKQYVALVVDQLLFLAR
jgi:hypothetical protein